MDNRSIREPGATAAGGGPKLRALHGGIDFYLPNKLPNDASYQKLRGCVSDIQSVEAMLKKRVTPEPEIVTLLAPNQGTDEPGGSRTSWPTYANITAALHALLARTQPGDQAYIHFSGHGGRVPTRFEDLKGLPYDVTLVPMDIGGEETRYLRDLDVAYFLEALVAKKAVVSIVLDSCHSGGATRGDDLVPRCATGRSSRPRPHARHDEAPDGRRGLRRRAARRVEAAFGVWGGARRERYDLAPAGRGLRAPRGLSGRGDGLGDTRRRRRRADRGVPGHARGPQHALLYLGGGVRAGARGGGEHHPVADPTAPRSARSARPRRPLAAGGAHGARQQGRHEEGAGAAGCRQGAGDRGGRHVRDLPPRDDGLHAARMARGRRAGRDGDGGDELERR